MNAEQIMTRPVLTVRGEESLGDAVRLMLEKGISGLPVVDDAGKPIGMLTEGDLLRRAETHTERKHSRWMEFLLGPSRMAEEYVHAHSRRVKEVMSHKLVTVSPDTPLDQVVTIMEKHCIKRVPVVDGEQLVGIISRANLVRALMAVAPDIPAPSASDEDIRKRLVSELEKAGWTASNFLNVIVKDGVVHLSGLVTNSHECEALRVAAENVPGVKAVHTQFDWCDMMTGTVVDMPEEETPAPAARNTI
jgi:CBS domain-containing protein